MITERFTHPTPAGHAIARAVAEGSAAWLGDHYPQGVGWPGVANAARHVPATGAARAAVVDVLRAHNARLGNGATARLCDALLKPDARVVITGQQPGLFGGPLFTFEKAVAAVALAERIAADSPGPVVPVFWNQSEDHDLEEINRLEVQRPGGVERTRAPIVDEHRCFADIVIDESVVAWADAALVEAGLDHHALAGTLLPRLGEPFPEWTARILLAVLPDDLLVAEPCWFRALAAPLVRRAINEVDAWGAAFSRDTEAVRQLGFTPQIEPRDPSGLFLIDAATHARTRLFAAGGEWKTEGGVTHSAGDLLKLLDADPARFSTGVQIRPLVQQFLFPVVAQIGGPAEVAYFAQFPRLYARAGWTAPPILARPGSTVLGARDARAREALGLAGDALLHPPGEWAAPAQELNAADGVFADFTAAFERALPPLRQAATSDGLQRAVDGFVERVRFAQDKLQTTFRKDGERAGGVSTDRRRRLGDVVWPKGKPQERVFGLLHLLSRAGLPAIRNWLRTLDALENQHVICTFEEGDLAND